MKHAKRLAQMADDTKLSANQVAAALLERALDQGWKVRPPAEPEVVTPE